MTIELEAGGGIVVRWPNERLVLLVDGPIAWFVWNGRLVLSAIVGSA
jgi:hypothetical protein